MATFIGRGVTGHKRLMPVVTCTIVLTLMMAQAPYNPDLDAGHSASAFPTREVHFVLAQAPVESYKAPPGVDEAAVIAYHNQGNQFLALQMWDDAQAQFRASIALDPANPYSYNGLALSQYGQKNYGAAINSCLKAIELWPDYAYVRCTLGLALYYSGDYSMALDVLAEAIRLSRPGEAAYTLATALLKKFRDEGAENPGRGMFSLEADDSSISAFLDNRESFEDIFVSTPYNGSSGVAPGRASAEYERLREKKVVQLISDTSQLIGAASRYGGVVSELEASVLSAANTIRVSGTQGSELARYVEGTLGALGEERQAAAGFISRLDTSSPDEFVARSLEYQRTLMAMRQASLQLQETDRLIIYAALIIKQARHSMPGQADALERDLLDGMSIHDTQAEDKARLDHALHYLDDGLRALDTADYYYGLEALAFMDSELGTVRFRAMNLRTSDKLDSQAARQALGTVEYLAQLSIELQEQFTNMDTSRMLTPAELSAATGQRDPPPGLVAALSILAARPAYADDSSYSQNVQRALQRDRRLFDRSTSEYRGIPHAVGGMVRATQDLAGSAIDMTDALVSTVVIPIAGAYYGDSGAEIWSGVKGKYNAVGENYRNGTSGTRVLRTSTEYMEAVENLAEDAAVRVMAVPSASGGNLAPWVAGKLAKTGVGMFTALGKGINKVLDPTSTPGEVSHGVLNIGLTVASAGTSGLTAPMTGVNGAVRTAAGMGANGGVQQLTAALGQGFLTDKGKELVEWGVDKGTGFSPGPDQPNPGEPQTPTGETQGQEPAGGTTGGQPAADTPGGPDAGNNPTGQGSVSNPGGPGTGTPGSGAGNSGGTNSGGGANKGGNGGGGTQPGGGNVPPSRAMTCTISASVEAGPAPLRVTFTISGTDSAGNAATSFEFSRSDQSGASSVGTSHTVSFANPGTYTATAKAVGADGNKSPQASSSITVFAAPKAVLGSVPSGGYAPYSASFDFSGSTASGAGVKRYAFNDGKGGTHDSSSVSLTYDAPGGKKTYNISLTVYDEAGTASESATGSFDVYSEPVAAIRLSTELGEAPLAVTVDGTASQCFNGNFSSVQITDNAGHASTGQLAATFQYDDPGTYEITLAVTDAGGKSASVKASVEVTKALLAGKLVGTFSNPAPGTLELTLDPVNGTFTGYVNGGVIWTWGDSSGSVPYSGNLSGSYNPTTGVISGGLAGVCDGKEFTGSISGIISGNVGSGNWNAANEDGAYEGTWKAGG